MPSDRFQLRLSFLPAKVGFWICITWLMAACSTQLNASGQVSTRMQASQTAIPMPTQTESIATIPLPASTSTQLDQVLLTPTLQPSPSVTPSITSVPTETATPTPDTRPLPKYWREWPIVPTVSARAAEVFLAGQALGNNPHSFSRVGDCQSLPEVFLGIYDTDRYWLSENYQGLELTIDQFAGAFGQANQTVRDGFSVASVLSPLLADKKYCQGGETPLECEFRLHKPIVLFISLGTNWQPGAEVTFSENLRKIVDFTISQGVLPILMTKADNIEQDHLLNVAIAQVAYDTQMPLLNTWAAVQYLPNHGLKEDGIYLTTEAWDERSFTALIALDAIWKELALMINR